MPPLSFLPQLRGLHLDSFSLSGERIRLTVTTTRRTARCPLCQCRSGRVHSRYTRTLTDLPWNGHRVCLQIRARRFWCCRSPCRRRIFCERLPTLTRAHGRQTIALQQILESLGFALGGRPGERLAPTFGVVTSRMTLLRLVRAAPDPHPSTPRILGVDDWAKRKGRSYGTILIDLERHCPVDLLPDRSADTLVQWLTQHPGTEIISRDRAGAYADGARRGAPDAIQVADRWHLLKNLGDALERFLIRHDHLLQEASHDDLPPVHEELPPDLGEAMPKEMDHATASRAQSDPDERRARRLRRYDEVRLLHHDGMSLREIAQVTGLSRQTARRYAQAPVFPEMKRRAGRTTLLDPYEDRLLQRWNEGCRNGQQLYRELKADGYSGGRTSVTRYVTGLRHRCGLPARSHATGSTAITRPAAHRVSARWVVWLVLRHPADRTTEHRAYLSRLCRSDASTELVVSACQRFAAILRERRGADLDAWSKEAEESGSGELQSFVRSIRQDWAAVVAGLSLEISNGQTEGVRRVTQLWISPAGGWNWKGGFKVTRLTRRRKAMRTRAWRESGAGAEASRVLVPQDLCPMARA